MEGNEKAGPIQHELYIGEYSNYAVYVKSEKTIGGLSLAKKLFNFGGKNCGNLKWITNKLYKIECATKEIANELVKKQPFEAMSVYIPHYCKYISAVIRNIDDDLTDNELMELLSESTKIKSVYRYKRTIVVEGVSKQINTNTVKIEIECDELPEFIYAYGLRIKVHQFNQRIRSCKNCCKYGHIDKYCRGERKCENCGGNCESMCENTISCPSCSGEHVFNSEECLIKQREVIINRIMAERKVCYREARESFFKGLRESEDTPTYKQAATEFPALIDPQPEMKKRMTRDNNLQLKISYNKYKLNNMKKRYTAQTRFDKARLESKRIQQQNVYTQDIQPQNLLLINSQARNKTFTVNDTTDMSDTSENSQMDTTDMINTTTTLGLPKSFNNKSKTSNVKKNLTINNENRAIKL